MGLKEAFGALLGGTKLAAAKTDRLFAISTAAVTMQAGFGAKTAPAAALCFKPIELLQYEAARAEIEELLRFSEQETGSRFRVQADEFRFTWVILEDEDFEDLVTGIHLVSQTFIEKGIGEYLLCAIFRFDKEKPLYWVYSFRQGTFYPFVPAANRTRDNALEFRLRTLLERELPIEKETGKWYPLWGIPL